MQSNNVIEDFGYFWLTVSKFNQGKMSRYLFS